MARQLKSVCSFVAVLCIVFIQTTLAGASETPTKPQMARTEVRGTSISWQPYIEYEMATLTVSGPGDLDIRKEFAPGEALELLVVESNEYALEDGEYAWELRFSPVLEPGVREALQAARERDDTGIVDELKRKGRLPEEPMVLSGHFRIEGGSIVAPDVSEHRGGAQRLSGEEPAESEPGSDADTELTATKQTITGNLTVYDSICAGFDCLANESYGSDTIRLKENNLRIHFDDTSNSGSFPFNDWRLVANDTTNGGASYFAIEDSTAGRQVFKVEAGAPTNSLVVESDGDIGINTLNPVVEIHVVDGDTPTLRLEQDGSSGFSPQTWDVAGNETSFFIRDVTNGSTLPFRIFPSAASGSLIIGANDNVGVGLGSTTSPSATLHVKRTNGTAQVLIEEASTTKLARTLLNIQNNGIPYFRMTDTSPGGSSWTFQAEGPSFRFNKGGTGGAEVIVRSRNDASGNATLTVDGSVSADNVFFTSSRLAKHDFTAVDSLGVLEKVIALPISEWTFKDEVNGRRHIGPMAEEFQSSFDLGGSSRNISLIDTSGVALAAIQGLYTLLEEKDATIDELMERVAALEARLAQVQ